MLHVLLLLANTTGIKVVSVEIDLLHSLILEKLTKHWGY